MSTPRAHRLGPDAIRVLAALKAWPRSTSSAAPTLADLARKTRMSLESVRQHLLRLEEAGLATHEPGKWRSWEALK